MWVRGLCVWTEKTPVRICPDRHFLYISTESPFSLAKLILCMHAVVLLLIVFYAC